MTDNNDAEDFWRKTWGVAPEGRTMRKLYFPLSEVIAMVDATLQATDWSDSFMDAEDGQRTGPALMWVKDNGTYLMSNATPRLVSIPGVTERGIAVIYGRADSPTGPLVGEGEWDLARDICGGDDFAEYVEVGPNYLRDLQIAEAQGADWLTIMVDGEQFTVMVEIPRTKKVPRKVTVGDLKVGDIVAWSATVTEVTPSASGKMVSYTVTYHGPVGDVTSQHRSRATTDVYVYDVVPV